MDNYQNIAAPRHGHVQNHLSLKGRIMDNHWKLQRLIGAMFAITLGLIGMIPLSGCRLQNTPGATIAESPGHPNGKPTSVDGIGTARMRSSQQMKTQQFLDGRLPIGFYLYLYSWRQHKDPAARDLENAIDDIAARGFTYLYIGGVSDNPLWNRVLARCEEKRIAVVAQLDFAYLHSTTSDIDRLLQKTVPFIRKYKDNPALMAFSVCEEPGADLMPALRRYYQGILREIPDAPLNLVHSQLPALVDMEPPNPETIGTDRYAFWWEMSGHRATPQYALAWYHSSLNLFYQQAAHRGADFQAVFTANTIEKLITPEQVKSNYYGPGAKGDGAPQARDRFLRDVIALADKGNHGWHRGPGDLLRYWKYYRPPTNCVSAMCWLSIMEGARSVVSWSYSPLRKEMQNSSYRDNGRIRVEYTNSIRGWEDKGTPQLDEFSYFAQHVQRYARLVRTMEKEYADMDRKTLPLGHELAPAWECTAPAMRIGESDAVWRSFTVPGYAGRVAVVVNTRVGSWCANDRSPHLLDSNDTFRIDDRGNAVDYSPAQSLRSIPIRLLQPDIVCTDLASGTLIEADAQGAVNLPVTPGGGRFLYLGTQTEGARLMQEYLKPTGAP